MIALAIIVFAARASRVEESQRPIVASETSQHEPAEGTSSTG